MSKRIGVFLSSCGQLPESFQKAAEEVGEWIGRNKYTLVYGGARKGLMEVLAQSTKKNGGRTYGVVPQILVQRGQVSEAVDVAFHCADLNDRKAILMRESDILVALPGGVGTLDEIFTVLAANAIGTEAKPVVLYNVDGYWDGLLALLESIARQGLATGPSGYNLHVVSRAEELEAFFS